MARLQEFDPDVALERAMQLFWAQGFSESSMEELVKKTGVARAGLYKVFGDKSGLFQAALTKYVSENIEDMFRPLNTPDANLPEIEALFQRVVALAKAGRFRRGCFLVNSAQEVCGGRGEIGKLIQRTLTFQTRCFRMALENARRTGRVRKTLSPKQSADALIVSFFGLATLARAGAPWSVLDHASKASIASLK